MAAKRDRGARSKPMGYRGLEAALVLPSTSPAHAGM
jgi:hypothetical protein